MARRYRFIVMVLAVGLIVAYSPPFASADTILTYTGNPFNTFFNTTTTLPSYDTTMFVSMWFDLANPLGPNWNLMDLPVVHWMVSDGMDVFSDTNPYYNNLLLHTKFWFSTDATGAITGWEVVVGEQDSPREIFSEAGLGGFTGVVDSGYIRPPALDNTHYDEGFIFSSPGTWTVSVSAPEPSTLNYLIVAVSGLGFCLRKRLL